MSDNFKYPLTPERVTVRLRPELAQRIDALRRQEDMSVTGVMEAALNEYFARRDKPAKPNAMEALRRRGFIGAGTELPADLSSDYKRAVAEAVAKKHGG